MMFEVLCLMLLLPLLAQGDKDTECTATDGNHLKCKFPENINSTRKDFSVYFYPDTGGEEKVVDCVWISEQLHCIRQEGFECQQPVSDKAVIDVPTRFVNKTGSYRCNTNGYRPAVISSCRFSKIQGQEQTAACEADTTMGGPLVNLNCRFSFNVDSFSITQNTTVVAHFTKSECESSSAACRHVPGDSQDIFHVKLDVTGYPAGEYICHPDSSLPQLQVKGCMVSEESETEGPSVPVVAVVLPVICVLSVVSVVGILFIIRKRREKTCKTNEDAEKEAEHFEVVT
ncbi:uncharacterized protein LOC112567922 [Pomacea canaliculata]|uniref:uncharacterized protein LOC112567922 n=1 Tax=Pomacea canaliculata TaxID=400727 RepID=UPI000D726E22|nr:uncharacterized protein LOC112567922 [Pomacea canaliculata]XP_025100596.1 uncharacterized protein LOC112567922 [Pomacea canaliculata]